MTKITMQDVANYLNISKNSVSQALRNKNGVSEQTKLLVKQAAEELGYQYNFVEKKKESISSHPKEFLLLATTFALSQTSFFGIILSSIKKNVESSGNNLTVKEIKNFDFQDKDFQTKLSSTDWAGIFILSHIENTFIQNILSLEYPCVLVDHHHPHFKADAVTSQNITGAYTAVEYLIQLNHKKIGFIGEVTFSPSYDERQLGYMKALNDYSISFNNEYLITNIQEDQSKLYARLDALNNMPTAWFCVNSGLAFILNSYLQSKGYLVPDDISVLCFDDTEFTRLSQPPISCIATDLEFMGKTAVTLMEQRIESPNNPFVEVSITPELIVRTSTKTLNEEKS
ncbi:LacI family DNA-binding transcriptional regulator [Carnobacterium mobile]|uniref:LacI family DNA-binding transcriptional regulator n=1 Tax=Carnobacterium mobile TaxID=2750 RepID=UPI00055698E3|nr:LacI family DNA-binding transcriptional regulator [Carnobacterium mobile]